MSNNRNTTAPAAPAATATITRETFAKTLAARASSGDSAALTMLLEQRSQALGFAEMLQTLATRGKQTLTVILSSVDADTLDWLQKTLPKDSPQSAAIKTALSAARAAEPLRVEFHPIGTTKVGPAAAGKTNDQPMVTLSGRDTKGAWSHKAAARHWSMILRLAASPELCEQIRLAFNLPPAS